jgi:hypothetical protein
VKLKRDTSSRPANSGFISVPENSRRIDCQQSAGPDQYRAGEIAQRRTLQSQSPSNISNQILNLPDMPKESRFEKVLRKIEEFGEKLIYIHQDQDTTVVIMPEFSCGARGLILENKKSDNPAKADNSQL